MAKIFIPIDTGGHLTEASFLLDAFEDHDIVITTIDTPRSRALPYRTHIIPSYSGKFWPLRFCRLLPRMMAILWQEKPDIIFSTGAEIAIPFFYAGKLLGAKTIFVESLTRIDAPTWTGRVVYPICDLFLVQHEAMLQKYGAAARYEGSIL